ncbi:hypothetical protein Tco_0822881 [Tanacetum coccineum]|uniref:Uncharacterized protein n=1 Tax=Tanacetum coccineum TaxID=301880 RepID=A0ABQ5AIX7_9ASTR
MHANRSFNRNPGNHRLYHALMEALIEDENAMDKGVADTVKDHKRKHDDDEDDDDEDPPVGPNQDKNTKMRRTKESESLKKPTTTKETPKGKTLTKGSKTGKSALAKEPVEEPITEMIMNDVGDDVVRDDDQPQATSKPKTSKTLNPEWFKQPPRPPTLLILKVNKCPGLYVKLQSTYHSTTSSSSTQNVAFVSENTSSTNDVSTAYSVSNTSGQNSQYEQTSSYSLLAIQSSCPQLDHEDLELSLILKRRVEDLQLGVESYQKKLNITKPQKTFPEIELKEPYTPSYNPPGIVYEDLDKQKRVL